VSYRLTSARTLNIHEAIHGASQATSLPSPAKLLPDTKRAWCHWCGEAAELPPASLDIERVSQLTVLGVIINDRLTTSDHVTVKAADVLFKAAVRDESARSAATVSTSELNERNFLKLETCITRKPRKRAAVIAASIHGLASFRKFKSAVILNLTLDRVKVTSTCTVHVGLLARPSM